MGETKELQSEDTLLDVTKSYTQCTSFMVFTLLFLSVHLHNVSGVVSW